MNWINKDTEIYCSFAKKAGNTGCQMMNSAFYYYGLNKIYKSFSVDNIGLAVEAVETLNIKGFAITMPYKKEVLEFVDEMDDNVKEIGAANTVINNNGVLKAYNTDYLAAKEYLCYIANEVHQSFNDFYILGNGGYASAVKTAANSLGLNWTLITRHTWGMIKDLKNSIIYNCTPVENIQVDASNTLIDCIETTETGKKLATMQASHQFKLYTDLKFPY